MRERRPGRVVHVAPATGRHARTPTRTPARTWLGLPRVAAAVLVLVLGAAAVGVGIARHRTGSTPSGPLAAHAGRSSTQATPSSRPVAPLTPQPSASSNSASSNSASSSAQVPRTDAATKARTTVRALVAQYASSRVSVAVTDLTTGAVFTSGATGGMRLASVAKVEILETMLLQAGGPLTGSAARCAVPMIEHSDNAAADACFTLLGGSKAYSAAAHTLGLTGATTFDQGYLWGLNRSSASEQVQLLRNLKDADSPLPLAARRYALSLLTAVEADQRWGVPVIAAAGTTAAVKDGWLSVGDDDDLWAVNSDSIVEYHDHTLAMSIMTQHSSSEDAGIALVEKLARLAATAVATR